MAEAGRNQGFSGDLKALSGILGAGVVVFIKNTVLCF